MPSSTRVTTRAFLLTSFLLPLLSGCGAPPPDPAGAAAEVLSAPPGPVPRYGVWEASVSNPNTYTNPFEYAVISLDAVFTGPSGRSVTFRGFFDGNGRGGPAGDLWKVRFMPDEPGRWSYDLSFSDGTPIPGGRGSFRCAPSEIPGPARLDPGNPRFLADARGRPIHWRGYAIKHRLYREPLDQASAGAYIGEVIDPLVAGGGYNATYLAVPGPDNFDPEGRPGRGSRSLWGDFREYDLKAACFLDALIARLHEQRIWTAGWITFATQPTWNALWRNHRDWMMYFTARYGAYYNYFLWSPVWEVAELEDWVHRTDVMMSYLVSIDPWRRLQGVHDRAQREWEGWQSIHARQNQTRSVGTGNNRVTGVDPSLAPYGKAILGAEDLWEMAAGHHGQPRDGAEVRRGLWGELLAGVLPMYDENDDFAPPAGGVGHGEGEPFVRIAYDWWYDQVGYRDPAWTLLNEMLSTSDGQRCSGIPGREYVAFREGNGPIRLRLDRTEGTFSVSWLDPETGETWEDASAVEGGGGRTLHPPFDRHDVVVLLRRATAAIRR